MAAIWSIVFAHPAHHPRRRQSRGALASRPTGGHTPVAIALCLRRHVPDVTVREVWGKTVAAQWIHRPPPGTGGADETSAEATVGSCGYRMTWPTTPVALSGKRVSPPTGASTSPV